MASYVFSFAKLGKASKVEKLAKVAKVADAVDDVGDGTKVVVRSWSSNGSNNAPTLEIQYKDSSIPSKGIKIRY